MRNNDIKDVITESVKSTIDNFTLNIDDLTILFNFMNFLNKVNINTFFTKTAINEILNALTEKAEAQDVVLDFINSLHLEMMLRGIDLDNLSKSIITTISKVNSSDTLPTALVGQLKNGNVSVFITTLLLVRIYGIKTIVDIMDGREK